MKKIILPSLICFAFITSCSKDVKAPSTQTKNQSTTKTPTSPTQTQTTNNGQNEHHCGNSSHDHSNG